jgi:hypothetical protein
MKKVTTWAALGSVAINLALGFVIALVFSAAPAVQAHEMGRGAARDAGVQVSATAPQRNDAGDYLVAVRMGWAAG